MDDYNEPEPDITIAKPREDLYFKNHPATNEILLIIEIAKKSLLDDREVKAKLYAQAGIAEYWLINLVDRQVEVFANPSKSNYLITKKMTERDDLVIEQFGWSLSIQDLFQYLA